MVSLYIFKCSHCDLLYFGKTTNNIAEYKGSGVVWGRHLRKHRASREILLVKHYTDLEHASKIALRFSRIHNISRDSKWANLRDEDAKMGGKTWLDVPPSTGRIAPEHERAKMRTARAGRKPNLGKRHTQEVKEKIGKGSSRSKDKRVFLFMNETLGEIRIRTKRDLRKEFSNLDTSKLAALVNKHRTHTKGWVVL